MFSELHAYIILFDDVSLLRFYLSSKNVKRADISNLHVYTLVHV